MQQPPLGAAEQQFSQKLTQLTQEVLHGADKLSQFDVTARGSAKALEEQLAQLLRHNKSLLADLVHAANEQETPDQVQRVAAVAAHHQQELERAHAAVQQSRMRFQRNVQKHEELQRRELIGSVDFSQRQQKYAREQDVLDGSQDVTASLRRTRQLMMQNLEQTHGNISVLSASNRRLQTVGEELGGQKDLFKQTHKQQRVLHQQSWMDRWSMYMGFAFFLLCVGYISLRRTPDFIKQPVYSLLHMKQGGEPFTHSDYEAVNVPPGAFVPTEQTWGRGQGKLPPEWEAWDENFGGVSGPEDATGAFRDAEWLDAEQHEPVGRTGGQVWRRGQHGELLDHTGPPTPRQEHEAPHAGRQQQRPHADWQQQMRQHGGFDDGGVGECSSAGHAASECSNTPEAHQQGSGAPRQPGTPDGFDQGPEYFDEDQHEAQFAGEDDQWSMDEDSFPVPAGGAWGHGGPAGHHAQQHGLHGAPTAAGIVDPDAAADGAGQHKQAGPTGQGLAAPEGGEALDEDPDELEYWKQQREAEQQGEQDRISQEQRAAAAAAVAAEVERARAALQQQQEQQQRQDAAAPSGQAGEHIQHGQEVPHDDAQFEPVQTQQASADTTHAAGQQQQQQPDGAAVELPQEQPAHITDAQQVTAEQQLSEPHFEPVQPQQPQQQQQDDAQHAGEQLPADGAQSDHLGHGLQHDDAQREASQQWRGDAHFEPAQQQQQHHDTQLESAVQQQQQQHDAQAEPIHHQQQHDAQFEPAEQQQQRHDDAQSEPVHHHQQQQQQPAAQFEPVEQQQQHDGAHYEAPQPQPAGHVHPEQPPIEQQPQPPAPEAAGEAPHQVVEAPASPPASSVQHEDAAHQPATPDGGADTQHVADAAAAEHAALQHDLQQQQQQGQEAAGTGASTHAGQQPVFTGVAADAEGGGQHAAQEAQASDTGHAEHPAPAPVQHEEAPAHGHHQQQQEQRQEQHPPHGLDVQEHTAPAYHQEPEQQQQQQRVEEQQGQDATQHPADLHPAESDVERAAAEVVQEAAEAAAAARQVTQEVAAAFNHEMHAADAAAQQQPDGVPGEHPVGADTAVPDGGVVSAGHPGGVQQAAAGTEQPMVSGWERGDGHTEEQQQQHVDAATQWEEALMEQQQHAEQLPAEVTEQLAALEEQQAAAQHPAVSEVDAGHAGTPGQQDAAAAGEQQAENQQQELAVQEEQQPSAAADVEQPAAVTEAVEPTEKDVAPESHAAEAAVEQPAEAVQQQADAPFEHRDDAAQVEPDVPEQQQPPAMLTEHQHQHQQQPAAIGTQDTTPEQPVHTPEEHTAAQHEQHAPVDATAHYEAEAGDHHHESAPQHQGGAQPEAQEAVDETVERVLQQEGADGRGGAPEDVAADQQPAGHAASDDGADVDTQVQDGVQGQEQRQALQSEEHAAGSDSTGAAAGSSGAEEAGADHHEPEPPAQQPPEQQQGTHEQHLQQEQDQPQQQSSRGPAAAAPSAEPAAAAALPDLDAAEAPDVVNAVLAQKGSDVAARVRDKAVDPAAPAFVLPTSDNDDVMGSTDTESTGGLGSLVAGFWNKISWPGPAVAAASPLKLELRPLEGAEHFFDEPYNDYYFYYDDAEGNKVKAGQGKAAAAGSGAGAAAQHARPAADSWQAADFGYDDPEDNTDEQDYDVAADQAEGATLSQKQPAAQAAGRQHLQQQQQPLRQQGRNAEL